MFPFDNTNMALEPSFKKPSFQPYDLDQNPISNSPLIFSNFPSPFFDEHEDQLIPFNPPLIPPPQYHSQSANPSDHTTAGKGKKTTKKQSPKPTKKATAAVPRKRTTGKKDRHSKICTAQGIRDRRMRLSLQVARKFFDLQDLLGYDKASKTIEWLFNKSNKAIKDLASNITSAKTTRSTTESSECEEIIDSKIACNKPNTRDRESRERARARARCRTEEKMMIRKRIEDPVRSCKSSSTHLQKLGFVDREIRVPAYAAADDYSHHGQPSDVGTIEKLLGNSSSDYHCSAAVSIDPNTSFMGFLGNWDLLSSNDTLINYAVENNMNQASMPLPAAGNPLSIYSTTTPDFPFFHQ